DPRRRGVGDQGKRVRIFARPRGALSIFLVLVFLRLPRRRFLPSIARVTEEDGRVSTGTRKDGVLTCTR
ncbi:hypothetical protein B296_00058889, partial [Ensete ventricosum]